MKRTIGMSIALVALLSVAGLAETKSDYNHQYRIDASKAWDFAMRGNAASDQIGANNLWDQRVREDLMRDLSSAGFMQTSNGAPGYLIRYHLVTREQTRTEYINSGYPGFYGWRGRGFGWGAGFGSTTVWRIPYRRSLLVMDVTDAKTRQLVWRGYDSETIDFNKADQTINKAVEHLTKRFTHEMKLKSEA